VHGGATWNSNVNREQVKDSRLFLAFLLPCFIEIMMQHPNEDWGKPFIRLCSELENGKFTINILDTFCLDGHIPYQGLSEGNSIESV